ncbi:MAG: hypothetical protein KGL53_02750, partial [Elusimicrobia bacterium]|nr:hypothetical protein [Elusimicrobiota bacterium]
MIRPASLLLGVVCALGFARPAAAQVPSAPAAPVATVLSTSDIQWTWAHVTGEQGYIVEVATDMAAIVATPATEYLLLRSFTPNDESAIVVIATNNFGNSQPSPAGIAHTLAMPPASLAVTAVSK